MMDIHEKKVLISLAENIISYSNEQPGLQQLARIALKSLTAEPVKVPDKWYFQLTFDIPNLEKMTPYQAHGAAWEQCRAEALRMNAIDNAAQQYEALAGKSEAPPPPEPPTAPPIYIGNKTTFIKKREDKC